MTKKIIEESKDEKILALSNALINSINSNGVDIVNNERIIDIVSAYSVEHLIVLDMHYTFIELHKSVKEQEELNNLIDNTRKKVANEIGVQNFINCEKALVADGFVEHFGMGFLQSLDGMLRNYAITDYGKQAYKLVNNFKS